MALTIYQSRILSHIRIYGQITTDKAVELVGGQYHNERKYTSEILSRMVKANLIIREKPGLFTAGTGKKNKPATIDTSQTTLF